MTKARAANQQVIGTSTLVRTDEGLLQWVKTKAKRPSIADVDWGRVMAGVPYKPRQCIKGDVNDYMSVYPVSDTHLGMLAWHKECGESADIDIITRLTKQAIDTLVLSAPESALGVAEILGDFFHFDSTFPVTTKSGNFLDSDSRYGKVFEAGVELLLWIIDRLAQKHRQVHVIIAKGNHDELTAQHAATCMHHIYQRDERISVDTTASMFHFVQWGNVGIMVHHGDKTKISKLANVFASSSVWSATKYRYVHSGHVHKDQALDCGACLVESFRVIIPADSYAAGHGFGTTARELRRIDYHREHGRIATAYVNPSMLHL